VQRRDLLASGLAFNATISAVRAHAAEAAGPGAPPFLVEEWLNAAAPLDAPALRGKVGVVNFWTYSCIYVLRTLPYLKRWHEEYAPAGLQLVGIHTPEFAFEHLRSNVENAVSEFGIRYPVGQDNGYRTWRAWGNRAWPSFYLLDRDARIVMLREGEGHAMEMERTIRKRPPANPREMRWLPELPSRRQRPHGFQSHFQRERGADFRRPDAQERSCSPLPSGGVTSKAENSTSKPARSGVQHIGPTR
jgi:thiol-disulfide isomerase/thioredoxin